MMALRCWSRALFQLCPVLFLLLMLTPQFCCGKVEWIAGQDGNWNVASNWLPPRIPSSDDDVVVAIPGNYTVTVSRQTTTNSLDVQDPGVTLIITEDLTVRGTCSISGNVIVSLGATLTFNQAADVGGQLTLKDGVVKASTAPSIMTVTGMFVINDTNYNQVPSLDGVQLTVLGGIDWTEDGSQNLNLQNGGSFFVPAGTQLNMTSGKTIDGTAGTVQIDGSMTCKGKGPTDSCEINCNFVNGGSVLVSHATLVLSSASNISGSVSVTSGVLSLSGTHTFSVGSSVVISGTLTVIRGTTVVLSSFLLLQSVVAGSRYSNVDLKIALPPGRDHSIQTISCTDGTIAVVDSGGNYQLNVEVLTLLSGGSFDSSPRTNVSTLYMQSGSGVLTTKSGLTVQKSWQFNGGRVSGPGNVELLGSTEISSVGSTVYLDGTYLTVYGRFNFNRTATLSLSGNSHLTIAENSVLSFAAPGCKITGSSGSMDNLGLVQSEVHYTGTTTISVGTFNNLGRVVVSSELKNTLQVQSPGQLDGSYEVGEDDILILSGKIFGSPSAVVRGNGTLQSSGSLVRVSHLQVQSLLVSQGSFEISPALDKSNFSVANITVTGGKCLINPGIDQIKVGKLRVTGGTLTVAAKASVSRVEMTGGTIESRSSVQVTDQISWSGGTLLGVKGHKIIANKFSAYLTSAKYLRSTEIVITGYCQLHGYGMNIFLEDGSIVEIAAQATADVVGTDITLTSSDASGHLINYGNMEVSTDSFVAALSVRNFGSIDVISGSLRLSQPSSNYGNVTVNGNSTLTVSSGLSMSAASSVSGDGSLLLSPSASDELELVQVSLPSITVTSGNVLLTPYNSGKNLGQIAYVEVRGGELDLRDVPQDYGEPDTNHLQIDHVVIKGSGQLVVRNPLDVDRLSLLGGVLECHSNVSVSGRLLWGAGTISGSTLTQPQILAMGQTEFVNSDAKTLSSVTLFIMSTATWQGYGDISCRGGSFLYITRDGSFHIDTTATVRSDSGGNRLINEGLMVIGSDQDVTVQTRFQNRHKIAVRTYGCLTFSSSTSFPSGTVDLEQHSLLSFTGGDHWIMSAVTLMAMNTSTLQVSGGEMLIETLNFPGLVHVSGGLVVAYNVQSGLRMSELSLIGSGKMTINDRQKSMLAVDNITVSTSQSLTINIPVKSERLLISSGWIRGTGNMAITNCTWQGGSIAISEISATDLDLVGSNAKSLYGGHVSVQQMGFWSGSGALQVTDGGTLELAADSEISIVSTMTLRSYDGGVINNFGTLRHNPLLELPGCLTIDAYVVNHGVISALGNGGLVLSQETHCYGVLEVASENSTIQLISGAVNIYRTAKVTGKGTIRVRGGQFAADSSQANVGAIQVEGGSVKLSNKLGNISLTRVSVSGTGFFSSNGHLAINSLFVSGGTLEFSSSTRIHRANVTGGTVASQAANMTIDTLVWYGGYLAGYGTIVVDMATIRSSTKSKYVGAGSTLIFRRRAELIGGPFSVRLQSSANIINEANSTIIFTDGHGLMEDSSGTTTFVNYGRVEIRGEGARTATLDTDIRNRGILVVLSGTLQMRAKGTNDGTIDVKLNGTLSLSGYYSGLPSSVLSGDGALHISSGRTSCLGCLFTLKTITVTSGTLDIDNFNDSYINSIEQRGGLISVSLQSGLLTMHSLSAYGGTIQMSGSVTFQHQVLLSGGQLQLDADANVQGTLVFEGGTLSSPKLGSRAKLTVQRFLIDDSATVSTYPYYSWPTKVLSNIDLIVQSDASWKTETSGSLELLSNSRIEITSGAVFDVFVGESVSLRHGSLLNRGTTKFTGSNLRKSTTTTVSSTIENLGSIVIESGNAATFQTGMSCNGEVKIGNTSSLTLQGSTATSICRISGNRLTVASSSILSLTDTGSLNIQHLSVYGTIQLSNSISLVSLTVNSGTLSGGSNRNTDISIAKLFTWNGGTIRDIALGADEKVIVLGSGVLQSSKLVGQGEINFTDSTTGVDSASSVSFVLGSRIAFYGDCTIKGVSSSSGVIINEGTIELIWPGSSLVSNIPVHHQGRLRALGSQSRVQLSQSINNSLGILELVGAGSQLLIKGTSVGKSVIGSGSTFCATCRVTFSGGLLTLQTMSTSVLKLPYLALQQGRIAADISLSGKTEVEISEALVSGSSEIELKPGMATKRLVLNGGQVTLNGKQIQVQTLVFVQGNIGPKSDVSGSMEIDDLFVETANVKQIQSCQVVVRKKLIFTEASLTLEKNSNLEISGSATADFSGLSVKVTGQTKTSADGGVLVNNGLARISMDSERQALFAVYFVNNGQFDLTSGGVSLSGNSQMNGTIKSQADTTIEMAANSHTILSTASLTVLGLLKLSGSSTLVDIEAKKSSLGTVVIQSGALTLSSAACIKYLDIKGGTVKAMSSVGINHFSLISGTLDSQSIVDVNGLTTWKGGKIDKAPGAVVRFNGPTDIKSGLSGSPTLTSTGASCSNKSECSTCLADANCVWYDGTNTCVQRSVYNGNAGATCQSWIVALGSCPASPKCSLFQTAENCNRSSQCVFCIPSQSCVALSSACSSTTAVYWSSDSGGYWYTSYPQYWNTGKLPSQSSDVYIAKPVSVDLRYTSQRVKSITIGSSLSPPYQQPTLTVNVALTVTGSLTVRRGATISIGSSLTVTGTANVEGSIVWSYGTISGGSWVIGGILRSTGSSSRTLNSDLTLLGRASWEGGSITVGSGKTFNVSSSATVAVYQSGGLYGSSAVLAGSLRVLKSSTFTVSCRFVSSGNITVSSGGRLYLNNAGQVDGSIAINSDYSTAAVYVNGQSAVLSETSSVVGTGRLGVQSGNVAINTKLDHIKELYVSGGTVTLSTSQTLQSLVLEGGTVMTSHNCTVLGRSYVKKATLRGLATFTLMGPVIFQLGRYYYSYGFTLADTSIVLSGDSVTARDTSRYYYYYSTFFLSGSGNSQLIIDRNASLSVTSGRYFDVRGMAVVNRGSLLCGSEGSCRMTGGLDNDGRLIVRRNSLSVAGGLRTFRGSLVQVNSETTLSLLGGQSSMSLSSVVSIDGSLVIDSGTNSVVSRAEFLKCERLEVKSGTLDMVNSSVASIGRLIVSGSSRSLRRVFFHSRSASTNVVTVDSLSASSSSTVQLLGALHLRYVQLSGGLLQVSASEKVDVDVLLWSSGTIRGIGSSTTNTGVFRAQQIHLSQYYSKQLTNVRLVLVRSFYDSYGNTLTLKDTVVTIPSGHNVNFTTEGSSWRTSANSLVVVEGGLHINTVRSRRGGKGLDMYTNIDCHGRLAVLGGSVRLRYNSNFTGNISIERGSSLNVLDGTHVWSGFLDSSGSISAYSGNPMLTVQGPSVIASLSVSSGTVTFNVAPESLVLRRLSVSSGYYYYRSYYASYPRFYCQQNCSVSDRLWWTGGYLGATTSTAAVTASKDCLFYIYGSYYKYSTSGKLIIEGNAYIETGTVQLSGPLEITRSGTIDVLNSITVSGSTSSVVNYGLVTVHPGVTLSVLSSFLNTGRMVLFGSVRVSSGTTSGSLQLVDGGASFVVQGSTHTLARDAVVGGVGDIRVERGTLTISCDVGNHAPFDGRLDVAGGVMEFSGLSGAKLNISSLRVRGGTFKINSAKNSFIGNAGVTSGLMQIKNSINTSFTGVTLSGYSTTIDTDSDLTVTQTFLWGYRGALKGSGSVLILGHLNVYSERQSIEGVRVLTLGSATIGGSGYFYVNDPGKLIIPRGAYLTVLSSRTFTYSGRRGTMENAGVISLKGYSSAVTINTQLVNNGRMDIEKGSLTISVSSMSGTLRGYPGTMITLAGTATFKPTSRLLLSDTAVRSSGSISIESSNSTVVFKSLTVSSGTLKLNCPGGALITGDLVVTSGTLQVLVPVSVNRFLFNGGTITRSAPSGTLSVGEMVWTSGYVTTSSTVRADYWTISRDKLVVKSTGTKEIRGCGVASLGRALLTQRASLRFTYNGRLFNFGNMSVDSSRSSIGYSYYYYYGSRYTGSVVNDGRLTIDAGTTSVRFYVSLSSTGNVVVASGTFSLAGDSTFYNSSSLELKSSSSLTWERGTHTLMAESQLRLSEDSKLYSAGGTVNVYSNETGRFAIPEMSVSSGSITVWSSASLTRINKLTVTGGVVSLQPSTALDLVTLSGGRITLAVRADMADLRMTSGTLNGGSAGKVAVVSVGDFTYGGGTLASAVSSGKYFYVNVTGRLTMNGGGSSVQVLDRCDVFNYGDASIQTSSSLRLQNDARLVNTRQATLRLIHGLVTDRYYYYGRYTGSLFNFGTVLVETSGDVAQFAIQTQFVNTGGKVSVSLGVLNVDGGGRCNGTGSSISLEKGTTVRVSSKTFQCEASTFNGNGLIDVSSSTLQLNGGSLPISVRISGGTLSVPPQTHVKFSKSVRITSGTLTINGNADIVSSLDLEGGSMNGNGILLCRTTSLFRIEGSSSKYVSVDIHNAGELNVLANVYLYSLLRNEKGALIHMYADGRFSRGSSSPQIDNIGIFRCTDKSRQRCKTDVRLTNYGQINVAVGTLELSSSPSLFDGSEVTGPGTLLLSDRVEAGGIVRTDLHVNAGMTVTAPLYNYGTLVWNSGSFDPVSTVCTDSSYNPPGSSQIVPACIQLFVVNRGTIRLATTNVKTVGRGLVLSNRGDVQWSGGELRVSGSFQNELTGNVVVESKGSGSLTLRGDLSNNGNFTVSESSLTVSGGVSNYGAMRLVRATVEISGNYEQTSHSSLTEMEQSTMSAVAVRIENGKLQGSGTVHGNVYNLGGSVEPDALPNSLSIVGLFDQKDSGSLVIPVATQAGVVKTGLLNIDGNVNLDGSLFLTGNVRNLTVGNVYTVITFTGDRSGNVTADGVIPASSVYESGTVGVKLT